ncbi:MAG: DUF2624 domain-containing protein [Sporolactobacillus sp.]|jgi:hypothetical protein|nr:DUF2624 domain-containing protein [Sporolactobacillus sp.]MCI1881520.1 DUF2624 domain-containing protein [Sporolactobacillus sp.]
MHPMIRSVINQKINQVEGEELYRQALRLAIPVSRAQADRIAARVRGKSIDIFQPDDQVTIRQILTDELGPKMARELERRFNELISKFET